MAEIETTTPVVEADTSTPKPEAENVVETQSEEIRFSKAALSARLDRERRKILSELGVEKVDDAKAAIAELKKIRDSEKTETERLRAENDTLRQQYQKMTALEAVVSVRAKSELTSLSDAQREAVLSLAGEDSSAQLKAIETLRPTWTAAVAAAISPPAPVKQAPANTAPAVKAPPATSAESEN